MGQILAWAVLTLLTIVVGAGFELFAVTFISCLVIAAIWAVIVWGGILILDDLDSIF